MDSTRHGDTDTTPILVCPIVFWYVCGVRIRHDTMQNFGVSVLPSLNSNKSETCG